MNRSVFEKIGFLPGDILLPTDVDMGKWCSVAVDQYTSDGQYWADREAAVGEEPSTLRLVLPEYYLGKPEENQRIVKAGEMMRRYLAQSIFKEVKNSFIYIRREQTTGGFREGILGVCDLEKYDFRPESKAAIRATEATVAERIPPRLKVREQALLELPHILLLVDDATDSLFKAAREVTAVIPPVYDFVLPENGQRLTGKLISSEKLSSIEDAFAVLSDQPGFFLACGDGNHSLATAKALYEKKKAAGVPQEELTLARYCLAELINIRSEAMAFEPIHRLVTATLGELQAAADKTVGEESYTYRMLSSAGEETLILRGEKSLLPVAVLQSFLDGYPWKLDYIHDEEALRGFCNQKGVTGILLSPPQRDKLFPSVAALGVLPRKTFSLGHATDKRFYLEARRIAI